MSKRRVLGFVLLASSVGVAVACGPQNRMSWSNNPALQPQFSNLGVHGGKIGGAVLVTENGNPVSIAAHQGIVIETRGADGVWRKASWIVTPTPTGTNPDNTPTPTGTDPDSTPTATPSGTATATATATPTATDTNPTPTPTGTCGDTPTPTPTASGTATATPTPGAPVPVDAAIVADDSGSV
ncbi:MAG TPA: hypothetical protein VMV18_00720, partial [bacterium]|nr:hypothetical protein [bacterium]